jgi:hypothetical protein
MFDRRELILKAAVAIAGAMVLYQLCFFIVHINPLWHLKIPALPSLPAAAVVSKSTNTPPAKPVQSNTTQVANAKGTNGPPEATNAFAHASNYLAQATNSTRGTNLVARGTNLLAEATNALARETNSLAVLQGTSPGQVTGPPTNNVLLPPSGVATRGPAPGGPPGMSSGMMGIGPGGGPGMPPGFTAMGPGGPGMPKPGPELSPELQARLDRIIESEILAPMMRPLPMALLGIAGPDIFFRAPNGQTGLIKEGEELGGVKLLRIGINRVLVEEKGEQKELTIFAGLGSEPLMSTKQDSPK